MESLSNFIEQYHSVFTKPQFIHFSHIVHSLTICEEPSIQKFSFLHSKSRSSLSRFLSKSTWNQDHVELMYHIQLEKYIQEDSSLIFDDSLSKRPYAKKVEKVNYHFDHTQNKSVLGYSIVTSVIKSGEKIFPYSLKPYYRLEDCQSSSFKTKNQLASEIILSTKNQKNITDALFDSWYSNDEVIGACKEAGKNYVTRLKSNRNVTINHKKKWVREHAEMIQEKDWQEMRYNQERIKFFSTSAFISGIGSVHLVFSQMYNKKEKNWTETHYFISNLLEENPQLILEKYLTRVGIEDFHREAKQNIGLEGYFLRKCRGIEKYLFLVMLTYSILVMQSISTKLSIGRACQENKALLYEQVYQEILQNPDERWSKFHNLAKAGV